MQFLQRYLPVNNNTMRPVSLLCTINFFFIKSFNQNTVLVNTCKLIGNILDELYGNKRLVYFTRYPFQGTIQAVLQCLI